MKCNCGGELEIHYVSYIHEKHTHLACCKKCGMVNDIQTIISRCEVAESELARVRAEFTASVNLESVIHETASNRCSQENCCEDKDEAVRLLTIANNLRKGSEQKGGGVK